MSLMCVGVGVVCVCGGGFSLCLVLLKLRLPAAAAVMSERLLTRVRTRIIKQRVADRESCALGANRCCNHKEITQPMNKI